MYLNFCAYYHYLNSCSCDCCMIPVFSHFREYLTGFKKRKDARKIKGREIAEKKLKEEKRRLKMQV